MKVAIVGYFGFYGSMAEWVADAWEANGHKVSRIDRKKIYIPEGTKVVIFVDCSEDYSDSMPSKGEIESRADRPMNIYTNPLRVFWSLDAQMPGGIERSTNIARKCDLTFSSNYEQGVLLLRKFGIESELLPITYSESLLSYQEMPERNLDVVMIGNPNSTQRIQLWEQLKNRYKAYAGRAETQKIYTNSMKRAKIVVNQPTEPWDNILNNRLFEGMAVGALVLQKRLSTTLIEDLGFIEGRHFIYWSTFEDLFPKIDYYLKNYQERVSIGGQGLDFVKKYSMQNQCKKMEEIIKSKLAGNLLKNGFEAKVKYEGTPISSL